MIYKNRKKPAKHGKPQPSAAPAELPDNAPKVKLATVAGKTKRAAQKLGEFLTGK